MMRSLHGSCEDELAIAETSQNTVWRLLTECPTKWNRSSLGDRTYIGGASRKDVIVAADRCILQPWLAWLWSMSDLIQQVLSEGSGGKGS